MYLIKSALSIKFLFIFLILTATYFAQAPFEGKVKIEVSEEGKKHLIDYMVKGQLFRIEMKDLAEAGAMIFDSQSKKMLIVMPEQKMYMEMPLDYSDVESYFDDESYENKIKMTGEKKTIHGYECEKWIVEDDGNTAEAWVTDELGGFMLMGNPMGENGSDWKSKLNAQNYFPMQVNIFKAGKLINTVEVVDIKPQKLDNSLFSAPSGYQKFDMPSFDMQKMNQK